MGIGSRVKTRKDGKGVVTGLEQTPIGPVATVKLDEAWRSPSGSFDYRVDDLRDA